MTNRKISVVAVMALIAGLIVFAAQTTHVAFAQEGARGAEGVRSGNHDDGDDDDYSDMGAGAREFSPKGIVVDDDNRCRTKKGARQFTTIQAGVDNARAGETVQVCPGTYREQVRVNKSINIIGVRFGNESQILVQPAAATANTTSTGDGSPIAAIIIVDGVRNVLIENVTADGANSVGTRLVGIFFRNASGKASYVAVRNINPNANNGSVGILAQGAGTQLEVADSSVHDYDRGGIVANGTGVVLTARGNRVSGSGERSTTLQNGIQIGFGATGTIADNHVVNNFFGACTSVEACAQTGGAANILAFGSGTGPQRDLRVTGNTVARSQNNIALGGALADGTLLTIEDARVERNNVFDTDVFDGITIVGDDNRITRNRIFNSRRNAIFVFGDGNRVAGNVINEALVGIFANDATSDDNVRMNRFFNTRTLIVTDDSDANSPNARTNASQTLRSEMRINPVE